jgi:hypothetical protein
MGTAARLRDAARTAPRRDQAGPKPQARQGAQGQSRGGAKSRRTPPLPLSLRFSPFVRLRSERSPQVRRTANWKLCQLVVGGVRPREWTIWDSTQGGKARTPKIFP